MKQVLKYPVYAHFSDKTITVYQAYNEGIGHAAARANSLDVPGFSQSRMTWIKPSYLWMMYRCGWGGKDVNQETILRIELRHEVFVDLLKNACLSSFSPEMYPTLDAWQDDLATRPNRVQWDPDRDFYHKPLDRRAIQLGISGLFVGRYLDGIEAIEDITEQAQHVRSLVHAGDTEAALKLLPKEIEY